MSTTHPEIPRLVFTITRLKAPAYYLQERNPPLGLVFVDREEPLHPRRTAALMRDEQVRELMGDFYVGGTFRWSTHDHNRWFKGPLYHYNPAGKEQGILINQHNVCTPGAVNPPNERLYVMSEGRLFKTTAHDIYATCRELHRLIGCDRCPIDPDECMRRHTRLDVDQLGLPGLGSQHQDFISERFLQRRHDQTFCLGDIESEWRHWRTEIGGHVYIPPGLAGPWATRPGKQVYLPYELSFSAATLDGNREELSARSKQAAKTRRTKRIECANCYFGGKGYGTVYSCDKYAPRHCQHGAWTEEQIIDETLGAFERQLNLGGFTMRQFEQMLAIGGKTLYLKTTDNKRPWKYVIAGFTFHGTTTPMVRIELLRVAADFRGEAYHFTSMEEFLPHLSKDLRRIFDEAPTLSRKTRAVAAQMCCAAAIESYICIQGCIRQVQPSISHVRVTNGFLVEVGYWLQSYWRNRVISSLSDIYNHLDCLPMFNIHHEPKEGVLNFRYHHWPR